MTDYGVRPFRRAATPILLAHAALLLAGLIVLAVVGLTYLKDRRAAIATAADWKIEGAPCPTFDKAGFDNISHRKPMPVTYDGMTVVRRNGHIMCTAVTKAGGKGFGTYPVCQMTAPQAVHVVASRGDVYFVPGIGHPATVSAPNGVPTCVMASKFSL